VRKNWCRSVSTAQADYRDSLIFGWPQHVRFGRQRYALGGIYFRTSLEDPIRLGSAQTDVIADVAEVLALLIHSGRRLSSVTAEPLVDNACLSFDAEVTPRRPRRPVIICLPTLGDLLIRGLR
jgi:hypothetical protein